jgi:hypothetical protein
MISSPPVGANHDSPLHKTFLHHSPINVQSVSAGSIIRQFISSITRKIVAQFGGASDDWRRINGDDNMEPWYSLILGDGMTASTPADEIEASFKQAFIVAGKPRGMAVFTHSDSEGRLHCEVTAYFSPSAAEVAKKFEARPCAKPSRMGLVRLAGDEEAWSVLFP